MQIVGQPCEVCGEAIKSELDGVGCLACQICFHDACVLAPAPVPEAAADTYRSGPAKPPKRKAASRKVRCPTCGVDARKEHRERYRAVAAEREAYDERRRALAVVNAGRGASYVVLRLVVGLVLIALAVLIRIMRHR